MIHIVLPNPDYEDRFLLQVHQPPTAIAAARLFIPSDIVLTIISVAFFVFRVLRYFSRILKISLLYTRRGGKAVFRTKTELIITHCDADLPKRSAPLFVFLNLLKKFFDFGNIFSLPPRYYIEGPFEKAVISFVNTAPTFSKKVTR